LQVLVTDDNYVPALGIVRSLGRKGIRVAVLSKSRNRLASYSRYCSSMFVVPSPNEEGFLEALTAILRRVRFDLVVPVGYEFTAALARHKAEIESWTKVEVADFGKMNAAADKRYVYELAAAAGVPAPRTTCPSSLDDGLKVAAELRYPIVVKASHELAPHEVCYARSRTDLQLVLRNIWNKENANGNSRTMLQEYVPGFGCGFFALYQHGVAKRVFMHKRIRELPPSGGISSCAASFYDPKLQDYGTRLLDRLQWHGVAMVEFRFDQRDRDYKLMEINPKFWGSLDLALAAGVDFPYYLCQMAEGRTLAYSDEYNRNLRFHWPLWEMVHLLERPASIAAVVADSLNPRVKSNILLRDMRPSLFEPFSRLGARAEHFFKGQPQGHGVPASFEKPN
jgi:predicted ATP-grasp superfamily ATP-dependent carboligase